MKGFMHIVEIVLVTVLLFVVFTQFANIPAISDEWSMTKLQIMAGDILDSLEAKGANWLNRTQLEAEFNNTLPENIIYAVTLKNVIKPKIKIGCLCNSADFSAVEDILSPGWFVVNGVNTTFELVQVANASRLFSLDYDLALICGYRDLTANSQALRNFLLYDKGAVEISDTPVIDNVQRSIFGLSSGAKKSDSSEIIFSPSSLETGRETSKIYDYFAHIPIFYDAFENLGQWSGQASISSSFGNPFPSVNLSGNGCSTQDRLISTKFFTSFKAGEMDFDLYLSSGSSLFVAFGKGGGYDYLASLSSNQTSGYDSFYRRYPLQPMGTNASHLTEPLKWHHIKVVANESGFDLYNDGDKVAAAEPAGLLPSNISLYSKCGEVYVDNMRITYNRAEFGNFLNNENTTQLNNDSNKILLLQKGTSLPACIVNYNIEGINSGRTVWVSSASATEEYKTLVKSLVVWAAGDEYNVIKANLKRSVSSYIYKSLGNDMLQNAKITLELGYLY